MLDIVLIPKLLGLMFNVLYLSDTLVWDIGNYHFGNITLVRNYADLCLSSTNTSQAIENIFF